MREVFKCPETYVTLLRPAVDDDTQTIDSSWQAAWPTSALRLLDAIEASCFPCLVNMITCAAWR